MARKPRKSDAAAEQAIIEQIERLDYVFDRMLPTWEAIQKSLQKAQ